MCDAMRSSTTPWRISPMISSSDSCAIISRRCSNTTLRWSFMTLSNFSMFLRMSKLRASTFCWAFSNALLIQGWMIASPSLQAELDQHGVHAVGAEDAHQIVLKRQEEFRLAGIALASRAAAQLVVDAAALVAFGADDVEAAGRDRLLLEVGDFCADRLFLRARAGLAFEPRAFLLQAHVEIAAELDVGAAAGHVGGDGDRARHAGLGDDIGFLLVEAGVEHGELLRRLARARGGIQLVQRAGRAEIDHACSPCSSGNRRAARISRSRSCRPACGWAMALAASISVTIAFSFSAEVR